MHEPIEGGSELRIGFDKEFFTYYLPPAGYVINRMPDPKTGKPRNTLEKREILFANLPIEQQKWKRTPLPPNWRKLRNEEKSKQAQDKNYYNSELEVFREDQWDKRLNGCWMAIGNKSGQPSEYVYLTGLAYFFFNWWYMGFTETPDGYPFFRFTYLKVFYAIDYAESSPNYYGVILSTLRRYGKTAIEGAFLYELVSRRSNHHAGLQAQTRDNAKDKFQECVVFPWRHLPDFFKPPHDYKSQQADKLEFTVPLPTGEKKAIDYDVEDDESLYSKITFEKTDALAYDKAKLHRYVIEEPGKIENESVLKMWQQVKPAMKNGPTIIGTSFIPTTVEEMNKGGKEFVELFEQSFPSWADKLPNNQTKSGLLALFIPGTDGYIFDEYGRSIVDDPAPNEKIYNEHGKRILKGALREIMEEREGQKDDLDNYTQIIRKYPLSWSEAKLSSVANCIFNTKILMDVSERIHNGLTPKGRRCNLEWVEGKKDGDVEIQWDEYGGRCTIYWLPDDIEKESKGVIKIYNNVGEDVEYEDGKAVRVWYPKNDGLFAFGGDPIKYVKTEDTRASKHSFWLKKKRKLNKVYKDNEGKVIYEEKKDSIFDDNLILEYHYRPMDPMVAFEDTIKICKLFGVSVLPEDNISSLRQHMIARGYGRFVLYQENMGDMYYQENPKAEKGVDTNTKSIDLLIRKAIAHINRKGMDYYSPTLVKQLLEFDLAERHKYDAVMGWMYCLLAEESIVVEDTEEYDVGQFFEEYEYKGTNPVVVESEYSSGAGDDWDFF